MGWDVVFYIIVVVVVVIFRHCPQVKKELLETYKYDDKIENGPKAGKIPGET